LIYSGVNSSKSDIEIGYEAAEPDDEGDEMMRKYSFL
jgi:hypothetical protein